MFHVSIAPFGRENAAPAEDGSTLCSPTVGEVYSVLLHMGYPRYYFIVYKSMLGDYKSRGRPQAAPTYGKTILQIYNIL